MNKPPPRGAGLKDRIRDAAVTLLSQNPEGLRYSVLSRHLLEQAPNFKPATVNSAIWNLDSLRSSCVFKPSKGLYKHVKYRGEGLTESSASRETAIANPIAESDFYVPFSDWLKNDLEEVTQAIALGRNKFRDKWGTPDVIGKRESRRSDVIKAPTEIVTAEIKADTLQLVTAFGQACAYLLYSHKTYLVIPKQSSDDEIARLDSLCELIGIGLVQFDNTNPLAPDFRLSVRARKHEPDLFFTNKYISYIERELFS
jgi:hypothetical protein